MVYAAGWVFGRPLIRSWRDFFAWAGSGLVYGVLVGLGAYLFTLVHPCPPVCTSACSHLCLLVPVIFGVPWVLGAQLVAEIIFVGLVSYEVESDSHREWLGRAAGWLIIGAAAWGVTAILVFVGDYLVQLSYVSIRQLVAAGGVTGIVTALLGSSSKTPAKPTNSNQGWITALVFNIALAVVGPIFVATLVITLSIALDRALLGGSLVELLRSYAQSNDLLADIWRSNAPSTLRMALWLLFGGVIAGAVALLASYCVNINRFSLHALYRNRLIRAYLGASRQERHPDLFTGFDLKDNVRMHQLWPPKAGDLNARSLFHVINIALNAVVTKRLAWQERKAASFTVSPLHSGSAYLGYRSSETYGDGPHKGKDAGDNDDAVGRLPQVSGASRRHEPIRHHPRYGHGNLRRGRQPQYGIPLFTVGRIVACPV